MIRILRAVALLVFACTAGGCYAPSALFQPSEPNLTETADRVPGALFEFKDKAGDRRGELRVWCLGAEQADAGDGERRTYVDIGVEIENSSKRELSFERENARLRAVQLDGYEIDEVAPLDPDPTLRIAPNDVKKTYLTFELPAGVAPRDIRGFRFGWEVTDESDGRFADLTAFIRWRRPRNRGNYNAAWPLWGFTFGYGFGRYCW